MNYGKYTEAIRNGDKEAFRAYMDASLDSIFILVCRLIGSEDDARDIVQETYIKLWEKRLTLRREKSLYSYTRRVAVNKSYDFLRGLKRRGVLSKADYMDEIRNIASGTKADDEINEKEYAMILNALTSGLSAKQQMIFAMSAIERMNADEISEATGLSKNSIKSNLHHARKALKKKAERIL